MWKWLHPYAKHETQYHLCGKLSPFFGVIAVLLLAVGIVWGLAYAPASKIAEAKIKTGMNNGTTSKLSNTPP